MAHHYRELLAAARLLLARDAGQRGRLPTARIRRSISTAYYAAFAFAQEECAVRIVGGEARFLRRRRIFYRTLSHAGLRVALQKVAGNLPAMDVADFLFPAATHPRVPAFASAFALAFVETQAQRHAADYDLNATFSEFDARRTIAVIEGTIDGWIVAGSKADRDFKHALCLLMVLGGKLRNG